MSNHLLDSETKLDKVMESRKFDRIVTAILAGKYSWACVLILRFAGYNPLHYIPYRTYNRLMKNNSPQNSSDRLLEDNLSKNERDYLAVKSARVASKQPSYQINDLNYLESVSPTEKQLHGGNRVYLLEVDFSEDNFDFFEEQLALTA